MTASEILAKVKAVFNAPPIAPVAPVVPVAAATPPPAPIATGTPFKLQDGTDITIAIDDPAVSTTPDVGDLVSIAGAPAPAGDYTLEDGTTFTTDATGAITVIVAPAPQTQPDFAAPPTLTLEDRIKALEVKTGAPAMPTGYEAQFTAYEAKVTHQDEVIKGLFELVEKLVEMPSADPKTLTGAKKDQFDRAKKKEQALAELADAFESLKTTKKY